jgi:hypothetical protein
MATVLPDAGLGEDFSHRLCQAERVVEFPEGQQTSIGGAAELQLQSTVECGLLPNFLPIISRVRH